MTHPRPPRAIARAALHIVAACALIAGLIFLIAPSMWVTGSHYPVWLVLVAGFRLSLPLSFLWILRWLLPAPGDVESGAAKSCAWTGICVASAGLMWISEPGDLNVSVINTGLKDIPWFSLLIASESARVAVMRGSMRPHVVAIGAFALAIGSSLALGSNVMKVNRIESLLMRAFGCVAAHPWIAMICLAGLWLWVGLADRRRAVPTSVPE